MASRKPKPIEIKPISINPNASHKSEDDQEDGQEDQLPIEQTLEEARAEDAANGHQEPEAGTNDPVTVRIKLKWTNGMKQAATTAINDYLQSAGAMPSILDLFEILQGDEAFAHLDGRLNHKGQPLFSPYSLQSGINAIRKRVAKDIAADIKANGSTDLIPLPSLARVQVVRTKRVTDTRALSEFISNLPALRALREAVAEHLGE